MEDLEAGARSDLREWLQVLRRRRFVILLTVLVALGAALAYVFVKAPIYSATATVLVPEQQATADLNVANSQLQPSDALQRYLADQEQFAKGDAVKAEAQRTLHHAATVAISTSATADVLTFAADSGKRQDAAQEANAYANAYISASRQNQVAQYTQQVTALQESIANLQAKESHLAPSDPQVAALQQSVNTLTQTVEQTQAASQISSQVGPTLVHAAQAPLSPSSPKPTRDSVLGVLIGIVLGLGLAFLVDRLDDAINSREAAEGAAGGMPVIALLPQVDQWKDRASHHLALAEAPGSNVSEAYRTFRTAVQFLGIDEPKRVIGVTSSIPGEGKTTAVANLALSFAKAGQSVIIVSCDLRRPRVHEFFGIENRIGFTSVLLGATPLSEALLTVPQEPGLRILPSGPVPPNPAEILSMDRVRTVVDELATQADIVLLDCPPVLPVTDALLLSRLVDGMLVLASAKSTSTRQLARTVELLHQVDAPVLGLVINRIPTDSGFSYGYGYSYGYESLATGEGEVASPLDTKAAVSVRSSKGDRAQV